MDKFYHLIVLCGLLILLSCALTNATTTPSTSTTEQSRHTTTGILTGNISNSLPNNSVQNISTTTPPNSYSETSTSSNSTTSNSLSNSTITSPTVQTQITTVQINSSITDTTPTSVATQPASKPATTIESNTSLTTLNSSAVTAHGNESTSGTAATRLTTEKAPGNKTNNEPTGASLKLPEKSMTILFSVILGVIVLLVLGQIVYKVSRNKHRSVQYSHRPLYNEDTGEHFVVPDDTLVISGGLYDGPQIYNPTVAALNDEDQLTFSYTPTQLRLEFLHEEQGTDQDYEATSFETFKTSDTSHN
ncbi:sialomucin core protein 24-like isoform X2 [Astyanax mexicanus]|uniref:sialomucin core protein 24-like isoform X2 n=1 Tax=Astyanax mexicanus TaxID=7994 RepID=UPI000BBD5CB5|nr:sialomucin core protein 24-like isoform X2 [Astyanax mexicanus]